MARSGADRTVVCAAHAGTRVVVRAFHGWHGADLEVSAGRVIEVLRQYGVRPVQPPPVVLVNRWMEAGGRRARLAASQGVGDPLAFIDPARKARVRVDVIGIGAGLHDRLRAEHWPVEEFNSSNEPFASQDHERFENRRAVTFWQVRELLEVGRLALPRDDGLARELCAIGWTVSGTGRVQIERKGDVKSKLGGVSPILPMRSRWRSQLTAYRFPKAGRPAY